MSKIRLQGPENFGGFSHEGQSYVPDDDGVIEVPAHLPTHVLVAHGLKPAAEKVVKPLAKGVKGGAEMEYEPEDAKTLIDPVKDESGSAAYEIENPKPNKKAAKGVKGGAE